MGHVLRVTCSFVRGARVDLIFRSSIGHHLSRDGVNAPYMRQPWRQYSRCGLKEYAGRSLALPEPVGDAAPSLYRATPQGEECPRRVF